MDITALKTEAFLKAIRKSSKQKCKEMDAETEKVRTIRLEDVHAEAQKKYKDYMDYEKDRIHAKTNREISALQEESKKELTTLRETLCNTLFAEVEADLAAFRESDAYPQRLLQDAKSIAEYVKAEQPILYLSPMDKKYQEEIQKVFLKPCEFSWDESILLGGIRAFAKDSKQILDFTIDAQLDEEKEWFLEHSGFVIEE